MTPRPFSRNACWTFATVAALIAGLTFAAAPSAAQRPSGKGTGKKDGADDAPAQKKDQGKKDAPKQSGDPDKEKQPQAVDLETDDGVLIAATYFPSKRGRESPAVILLHGLGEKQKIFTPSNDDATDLAFVLQDKGYAVITFDFRGHGYSTKMSQRIGRGDAKAGGTAAKDLKYKDFRTPADFETMLLDIEAAKRFLVRRNNAGELNVSKLGVVGTELGASLGILWSHHDWMYPAQKGFVGKQGQDVLSIVAISPSYNLKGVTIQKQLPDLQKVVPFLVIAGKNDTKAFNEAKKVADAAKRARPTDGEIKLVEVNSKYQGSSLLNPVLATPEIEQEVREAIVSYLEATLRKKIAKWEMREVSDESTASGK